MNVLRATIGVIGLALLAVVAWAAFALQDLHGSFMDQLAVLTTLPWGVATIADLYVGFFFFAVVVFLTERSWMLALVWALPIFIVGHIWSALWLVVRLPHLAKALAKSDWPAS